MKNASSPSRGLNQRCSVKFSSRRVAGASPGWLRHTWKNIAGVMSREELFEHCDVIPLPKPIEAVFSVPLVPSTR
jgi:hypothetical protein